MHQEIQPGPRAQVCSLASAIALAAQIVSPFIQLRARYQGYNNKTWFLPQASSQSGGQRLTCKQIITTECTKGAQRKARLTIWLHTDTIMSLGGMVNYTEMTDFMVSWTEKEQGFQTKVASRKPINYVVGYTCPSNHYPNSKDDYYAKDKLQNKKVEHHPSCLHFILFCFIH